MSRKRRKSGRRNNHEGTIIKRKDGRFQASIMYKGKRRYHYSYNKKECQDWLLEMQVKAQEGVSFVNGRMTLISWVLRYIELYCKPYVRSATLTNYYCYANKHLPRYPIAEMPLEGISVDNAQAFVNELSSDNGRLDGKGKLSSKTIRSIMLFLTAAMSQAQANGYVRTNVFSVAKLPKLHAERKPFLSEQEVEVLLKAAIGHPYSIGLEIASEVGLRVSELLALRHSSVVEHDGIPCLNIIYALKRKYNHDAKDGEPKTVLHLSEPKTETSKALVPISPELFDKIKVHVDKQRDFVRLGVYQDDPFLVCNDRGGFIDPSTFRSFMRKAVADAGLPTTVTPHALRHYAASTLIRHNASVTATARILRHAQSSTTLNVYAEESLQGAYDALLLSKHNTSKAKSSLYMEDSK